MSPSGSSRGSGEIYLFMKFGVPGDVSREPPESLGGFRVLQRFLGVLEKVLCFLQEDLKVLGALDETVVFLERVPLLFKESQIP